MLKRLLTSVAGYRAVQQEGVGVWLLDGLGSPRRCVTRSTVSATAALCIIPRSDLRDSSRSWMLCQLQKALCTSADGTTCLSEGWCCESELRQQSVWVSTDTPLWPTKPSDNL
jgi:hypothetical protein